MIDLKSFSRLRDTRRIMLEHWRESISNELLVHVVRDAGRVCTRALQLRLAAHAVSHGHWTHLRELWLEDGLTQHELSIRVGVMGSTTFSALKAMEKLGYVVRKRAPSNKKNAYVYLTPRGWALQGKLVPLGVDVNRIAAQRVGESALATTRRTLLAIIDNLSRDELMSPDPKPLGCETREAILHHWRVAVPNDRLAHLVRDAGRACVRALQIRLARHKVPYGHWLFLRILWEADGLTQRHLSLTAGVMASTAITALHAMEDLGYVERRQLPTNKKNVYVHLTKAGRTLQKKLGPLRDDLNRVAATGVEDADVGVTRATLRAMIENLVRDELASDDRNRRVMSTREMARLIRQAS